MYSVSDETRKPIFEGVQGENEAREIQFDITSWIEELGEGVCTATAKRPTDTTPYPVTVTRSGNVVTWKPNSTDTSIEGIGAFQLSFSINDVVAKTRIWNTKIAPSLVGAGDPPDPYDDWIQDLRDIAAETLIYSQNAANSADDAETEKFESEAWAKGTKNGTPVSSSDAQYQNNSKYFAEESYKNAEAWAVGQRGGVDVPSTDPTYENNAKYWAEQSAENQYGAFIVKSASGDIASFNDGADDVPMKSVKVAITPKQAGSGDPSPDNVRPITGWSTVNLSQSAFGECAPNPITGKNLFASDKMNVLVPCHIPASTAIVISADGATAPVFRYYDANKSEIDYWTLSQYSGGRNYKAITTLSRTTEYVQFTGATNTKFMIELGSTLTSYEPYGTTTPVPLGQTVYGGEVDVDTGVLTITHEMADLGSFVYTYRADVKYFYTELPAGVHAKNSGLHCICEKYRTVEGYNPNGGINDVTQNNAVSVGSSFQSYSSNLIVRDTTYTDATAFKTAVTGTKLVYELAVPTTVQLTPTQVASLLGQNNVWSDAGDIAVEYRADPTLAYNELANVIVSLGGNI